MRCSSLLEFIQHTNINLYIVVIRSTVSTQNRNSELWIKQHLLVVVLTTFKGFFYHSFGRRGPYFFQGGKREVTRRPH